MSQSRRYTWRAQPLRHALRHLTIINMFFFKTYQAWTIWSEIAIRKGSTASTIYNVDCSTILQTTTCTYTNTNNSQSMHTFIHSFIQSTIFTLSLFHQNEPSITTAIHHNHPSINHALHGLLSMAFVYARMPLPWLAHDGMECICMHTACQPPLYRDTYIYMHACRDDDFLSPTECADEHLRWWWWWWWWWLWWWWYLPRSRYSS